MMFRKKGMVLGMGLTAALILLACGWIRVRAGALPTAKVLFEEAGQALASGNPDRALTLYDRIEKNYGVSPALLANRGQAFQQKGILGQAMLNYEQALVLDPDLSNARANLTKARKDAGVFSTPAGLMERAARIFSADGWAWVILTGLGGLGFLMLLRGLALVRPEFARLLNPVPFKTVVVSLMLAAFAGTLGLVDHARDLDGLIVTADRSELLISPFDGAQRVTWLKAGEKVRPLQRHQGYQYVEASNGVTGWIKAPNTSPLVPFSAIPDPPPSSPFL